MWKIFLILAVTLSGCGGYIDPSFKPYSAQFVKDGLSRGRALNTENLTLEFSDKPLSSDEMGQCSNQWLKPHILIDRAMWTVLSETMRTLLIYHEMGHCILGRNHTSDPKSIMNAQPGPWVQKTFADDKSASLNELFDQ